jgi:hypothetical protein
MAIKESEIQNTICDYLALREKQKMLLYWRQNTGAIYDVKNGIHRAMPKHAKKGVPDICVIKKGKFIGLEVKSATGKQSDDQKLFELFVTDNGGFYYLVRSLEDVRKIGL